MTVDISIDPGSNHTGWCIWEDGKPRVGTLHVPAKITEFTDKLEWLKSHLEAMFLDLYETGGINRVAIEEFVGKHRAHEKGQDMTAMLKCATARGVIFCLAHSYAQSVFFVSKGTITKEATAVRCRGMGIGKCSADARDALEIGVAAGFDRRAQ